LAADECPTTTMTDRFNRISLENNVENRRAYKEVIFTSDKEWADYVSGVILYEETLHQNTKDNRNFVKILNDLNIVVGVTLDKGQEDGGMREIAGTNGDIRILGSDNLDDKAKEYYKLGARFGKWRAVAKVSDKNPSQLAIDQTARDLARYAAICQSNGLVPIVEPEVLVMDGSHDINKSFEVTEKLLSAVFRELVVNGVVLERIILKPNMVLPGNDSPHKASVDQVAEYTLKALQRTVPPAVPIIAFLSGGQTEEEAAEHLNRINTLPGPRPWSVSFSYGRALQQSALRAWQGSSKNTVPAQKAFIKTCKNAYLAAQGKL
jgi:fructose-bisphosphate aldolase class I